MSKPQKSFYSLLSFWSYMRQYKLRIAIVLFVFVVANGLLAVIPVYIGKLIGLLAVSPHASGQAFMYVWILIGCSLGHSMLWRVAEYAFLKLLKPMTYRYENILFQQIIQKPYPYFVDKFTGKIASYIYTISDEFRQLMESIFWSYADKVVSLVAVSIILTAINWQTGVLFISGLLLMLIIGRYTIRNSSRYEKQLADVKSTKNGKIIDAMANFVNVKSFHKEHDEIAAIKVEQEKALQTASKTFLWSMFFWGSMSFFVREIMWPATIILNVYLFLHGEITLAQLTTFMTAVLMFTAFIWEIIWEVSQFNLKLARIEEAHQYLFGANNVAQQHYASLQASPNLPVLGRTLSLEDLSFAYPDKKQTTVLSDINLSIKKGEKIGVVGKSGSGKTTITKLLLGYYPLEHGQIVLDGEPIDTSDIARIISYVPQDTTLFHRTIAENIAYASDDGKSRDEIIAAAKQAHADEFITQISDGYEALVGERGVKLSAGQRQRIAIARAFLDDKPILVLDEATSALDSESEVLIQEALEALWEEKTVIAIAHRLSTLRHMDRIIVIDAGRIIEEGSHTELLKLKGAYAKLWAHQSGGFIEE